MQTINLTNSQKRVAQLLLVPSRPPAEIKRVTQIGNETFEPVSQSIVARLDWLRGRTGEQVAADLIDHDPEIDLNLIGRPICPRSRVYLDQQGQVTRNFNVKETRFDAKGAVKDTRPYRVAEPNLEHPIPFSGKFVSIADAATKYVFHRTYSVVHQDSLTCDFLRDFCKELEPRGLLLIRAGIQGNEPLVMSRGGLQAQGFLWGRTSENGEKYSCRLLLTFQELKLPAAI